MLGITLSTSWQNIPHLHTLHLPSKVPDICMLSEHPTNSYQVWLGKHCSPSAGTELWFRMKPITSLLGELFEWQILHSQKKKNKGKENRDNPLVEATLGFPEWKMATPRHEGGGEALVLRLPQLLNVCSLRDCSESLVACFPQPWPPRLGNEKGGGNRVQWQPCSVTPSF